MVGIKTIKEAITELLSLEDYEKDTLISELSEHGYNYTSVSRTLRLMRDAGQVEIGKDDHVSLLSPHVSIPERADLDKEILKWKTKAQALQKLYKEAQRTNIMQDYLREAIEEHCASFEPQLPVAMPEPDIHTVKEMACLHVSDWHGGEVVTSSDTAGINEYNMGIMANRAQHLAETVVNLCHGKLQGYTLRVLSIFMLGDFVSTNIHNILANSGITPVDSLFMCAAILGQFIVDLARYFEIYIFTVPGNHGRITEDIQYKSQHANWDNLLYHMLRVMLKSQTNVHFNISKSPFTIVRLNGWRWLLYHGGNIRSWQGIPFYGIIRAFHSIRSLLSKKAFKGTQREYALNKLQEVEEKQKRYDYLLETDGDVEELAALEGYLLSCTVEFSDMLHQASEVAFDYVALAHFHTSATMDLGSAELFMNGSAIGPTDYVVGKMFRGCRPTHWLHGIHHDWGATWRYPVVLDAVPEGMEERYKSVAEWEMASMWAKEEVSLTI